MKQARLYLTARKPEAFHIASILDPILEEEGITSALFEDDQNSGKWCYAVYADKQDIPQYRRLMRDKLGADTFGLSIHEEVLEDRDWVKETLRELKPVQAGRFFVHGSHDRAAASKARIAVEIDAGLAFGTGHHGTTAGCLDMLETCLRRHHQSGWPQRAYDVGTGSGVLAIALAKTLKIKVLATDIDSIAVDVARQNAVLNGTGNQVKTAVAAGFQNRAFGMFGPADLVFANILARPLEQLARPMRSHLAPGAWVILSGLLPHQKARIVSAYSLQGLVLHKHLIRDGWLTLLMRA